MVREILSESFVGVSLYQKHSLEDKERTAQSQRTDNVNKINKASWHCVNL